MRNNKPTILIVDDEPIIISVIGDLLSKIYDVVVATSGEKALDFLSKNHFVDLILLDINMPNMNGYEVADKINSSDHSNAVPFIFLTAQYKKEDIIKGFQHGAVDYISKPFNHKELYARVATHTKLHILQSTLNQSL
jgi:CheY-like chemotaxis protein